MVLSQLSYSPNNLKKNTERGGAEGIRTPGLISAIDALSQLSYSPVHRRKVYRFAGFLSKQKQSPMRGDCLPLRPMPWIKDNRAADAPGWDGAAG